ncbi:MAG: permease prefix domain 1-containing protein [Terriglobales bacterium]|jgi:hypothetical protein
MNAIVRFFKRLGILFTRARFHRELEEEMAFHREQQEKALQAEGMAPEAAKYAAKRQFGNAARKSCTAFSNRNPTASRLSSFRRIWA